MWVTQQQQTISSHLHMLNPSRQLPLHLHRPLPDQQGADQPMTWSGRLDRLSSLKSVILCKLSIPRVLPATALITFVTCYLQTCISFPLAHFCLSHISRVYPSALLQSRNSNNFLYWFFIILSFEKPAALRECASPPLEVRKIYAFHDNATNIKFTIKLAK